MITNIINLVLFIFTINVLASVDCCLLLLMFLYVCPPQRRQHRWTKIEGGRARKQVWAKAGAGAGTERGQQMDRWAGVGRGGGGARDERAMQHLIVIILHTILLLSSKKILKIVHESCAMVVMQIK